MTQDRAKTHSVRTAIWLSMRLTDKSLFPGATLQDKTSTGLDVKQNDPHDAQQPPHPCLLLLLQSLSAVMPEAPTCS